MKKNYLIRIGITLIIGFGIYYLFLPALNITSPGFWAYLLFIFLVYEFTSIINIKNTIINRNGNIVINGFKKTAIVVLIPFITIALILLTNIIGSPLFMSSAYANRIDINSDSNFTKDIAEVNFSALPLLDKSSSQKLGDRVMGQMPELVSQFYVSDIYTQINYNNDIVRVTPLEYNGFFKYIANRKTGVKGYITVNSVSGESKLVKLENGMKYMPSAILSKNLYRHLRFSYPTLIFDNETFEIDNDGNPYWIVPTVKYNGIGIRKEITGAIIVDPITGKTQKYDVSNVPTWVDHVYSPDLIIEQVDDWGLYKNGFFNSLFSQKNVVMTTTGYNYTVMNDDVYLYTGITSVASDESNIGFILSNLRTKETVYYEVAGAEEYSAMASAEGQVQQMKYKATFPLLINLNNRPTYLISLKDNAGLIKMYAFVDVADYQKVVVTDATKGIEEAAKNYLGTAEFNNGDSLTNKQITIKSITSAIIDGTSYYYIIDTSNNKYRLSIKTAPLKIPFLKTNDTLDISYTILKDVTEIIKIN